MGTRIFKEKLFWVILISVLVGFIILEIFRKNITNLDAVLRLIQAIVSCLSVGLAYLLFDKFGLRKNIIEKQFDSIVALVKAFAKFRILYTIEDNKGMYMELGQVFIKKDMSGYKKKADRANKIVTINPDNYFKETKEFTEHLNDIWLPEEIREKFSFLVAFVFTRSKELEDSDTVKVAFNFGVIATHPPLPFYPINDLKYSDLINKIEESLEACEKWIINHAQHDFKFNL